MKDSMRKLRGRIVQKYGTQGQFAKAIKTSEQTVTAKLNGRSQFSQSDIVDWCNALDIETPKVGEYFFANELSKS